MILQNNAEIRIRRVQQGTPLAAQAAAFAANWSWEETREHVSAMLRDWSFTDWEAAFAALDGEKIIGLCTALKTDYYPLPGIFPWVSCLFVAEAYRGRRISGLLIDAANAYLREQGFTRSYIPTEYTGLYEHYGYRYLREIVNYGGGTDHLFVREF